MSTYFITAIDTDAGKSIITGYLARYFKACQKGIITMKLAQTGCNHLSEDIETHRNIIVITSYSIHYTKLYDCF